MDWLFNFPFEVNLNTDAIDQRFAALRLRIPAFSTGLSRRSRILLALLTGYSAISPGLL